MATFKITQAKQKREREQKEKRQAKGGARDRRKVQQAERKALVEQGLDPDLMGIHPGPQPIQK